MPPRKRQIVLAVDIGTSGSRAALYDHSAWILPNTLIKTGGPIVRTNDGGAVTDSDVAFRQAVAAIDGALARAAKINGEITHVAMSCFWHSLVGVDAAGKPTTKVLTWADNRSRDQVTELRRRFDESEVHERTGARFHSSYWPAKLRWLQRFEPQAFAETQTWLSLSDLIALRLSGKPETSISMASGTGLFDIRTCDWDTKLLRSLKINRGKFPKIVADDHEQFRLVSRFANRWPRLTDAFWHHAIGDGAANNIGAGCVEKNKAALMLGTSGAIRVAFKGAPPARIPEGLWCYRIDRERIIVGGALSDGGGLYYWLRRNLRIDISERAIHKEIARRGADAHGLTFLPFLAGERSTGYDEHARGAILGLTMAHDAIDILQAGMESVAYRLAAILRQLETVCPIEAIVGSGGALHASPLWGQMISDVLGRDIRISDEPEASLRGAVLLALESTGKIDLSDGSSQRTIAFHPACHEKYKIAEARHEKNVQLKNPNK